jgi:hypothetical protein
VTSLSHLEFLTPSLRIMGYGGILRDVHPDEAEPHQDEKEKEKKRVLYQVSHRLTALLGGRAAAQCLPTKTTAVAGPGGLACAD